MSENKVVFVILHYYTIEDTKKCINSIKSKCCNNNYEIVIVDNASPNNSGKILEKEYLKENKVHVILNSENLGFAKGNNIGFEYAKNKLNANFIILCNNDTYLIQDNFIDLIIEEYMNSKFAVLGPKIILKDNTINKIRLKIPNRKQVKKIIRNKKMDYITSVLYINGIYKILRNGVKWLLLKLKLKNKDISDNNLPNIRHENIVLHGCFLIFSKEYINKFDGLNDRTFLYMEEELLAIRLKKHNLKSVYSPILVICHNEDGATDAIMHTSRKKMIFTSKNILNSSKIVLEELSDYK